MSLVETDGGKLDVRGLGGRFTANLAQPGAVVLRAAIGVRGDGLDRTRGISEAARVSERPSTFRNVIFTLVVLALVALFASLTIPARTRPRTPAYLGIATTLQHIEDAKQHYAIGHKVPPGSAVSREQLLEYVPERFWDSHVEYHINVVGVGAEAVLLSRFGGLPAKTVIRVQTNLAYEIVLPKRWFSR